MKVRRVLWRLYGVTSTEKNPMCNIKTVLLSMKKDTLCKFANTLASKIENGECKLCQTLKCYTKPSHFC